MMQAAAPFRAMWLAAVAAHGFAVAPLVHALEHAAEAEEAGEPSDVRTGDPYQALMAALANAHGKPSGHRHHPPHSHGPGSGPHGEGALVHFALALHASPPPPQALLPPPPHPTPPRLDEQLHAAPRYLVPERSQAPPA